MLGSIHVGTSDMYPLNNALKEVFSKADTFVVEDNILAQNEQINQFILSGCHIVINYAK
ncbi:TraB/GumN family protein [Cellulosilyticum sp. WCF-2]|nr:TraB/GumN family protein [Cellulosilyticum sp. WCF-2]